MQRFHVRIFSDAMVFSASHFITLDAHTCEQLHGHNYRARAEVHGPLNEDGYVIDFIAVRDTLRAIVGELDHRVLLPADHRLIRVEAGAEEVEVTFAQRRWVFPRSECLLLPISNTTTELLAQYLAQRLFDALQSGGDARPASVRIDLEEGGGFAAVCEVS